MDEDRHAPLKELLHLADIPNVDVSNYCWTTRGFNILHAHNLTDAADLLDCSVPDLWALRQCGSRTVVDIVQALLTALVRAPGSAYSEQLPLPPVETAVERRASAGDVQDRETETGAPEIGAQDVPRLVSAWVASLDEREASIVRHRLIARDRTLDDLGRAFSVTRERIRQLERTLLQSLPAWRESAGIATALHELETGIRKAVSDVASERRLIAEISQVGAAVPALSCRVVDLLPILLPGIAAESGWVAVRPLADLRDETSCTALPPGETTSVVGQQTEVYGLRQRIGLTLDEWPLWLDYCGLRSVDGVIVQQGASIPERAAAVLGGSGEPMSAEQIAAKLGADSVRSVRNRLLDDARIARVGVNLYGLPEWGLETYEGIREEIVQRIDRAGGRIRISDLVSELVSQFGVSANSVQSYASGREFVRKDGWLFMAGAASARTVRSSRGAATPASTRRCFFRDGRWWFRVDVGADALRGSGFPVPVGAMCLFQVAEGSERILHADGVPVRISWTRSQPTFGSIRGLLLARQASAGDALWLTPAGHEGIEVRLCRPADTRDRDMIAHLTGVEPVEDLEVLRRGVASALGLPREKSWSALAQALRGRGDLDVAERLAEILPDEEEGTPSLDEFLSALRGR